VRETFLGADHPDTAETLTDLGNLCVSIYRTRYHTMEPARPRLTLC
jgi:hypothetical protein